MAGWQNMMGASKKAEAQKVMGQKPEQGWFAKGPISKDWVKERQDSGQLAKPQSWAIKPVKTDLSYL